MKFSLIVGGNEVPEHIARALEEQPARSGMFNWIFAHRGEINAFNQIKDNLEDYDQVQVNMTPVDMPFIPEIRRRLRNSSTKLILNNDYVPECWNRWQIDPYKYDNIQRMGDMVFSTEPHQVSNMLDGTFTIPHPTNTKYLKRMGTDLDAGQKSVGFLYHWWHGESYIPSRMLNKMKEKGLVGKTTVYAYKESADLMRKFNRFMFDKKAELMDFPDYMQRLQGESVIYDPCAYHTYGRNGVEMACVGKPVIGSNRVWSYNKLMPELTVDPYDYKDTERVFKFVREQPDKVKEIMARAKKEVEWFNYENSVKRWKDACEIAFDRGGHEWYQKQI